MIVIASLGALGLITASMALFIYNRLTHLAARSETAWSTIEALLKMRHELVPDLLETVKEYAAD